jgi:glycosyltransferase involved in cell wall biosynthesis
MISAQRRSKSMHYLNTENHRKYIHLWLPNMFEFTGGIQTYSTFLLKALQGLELDLKQELFIKHDTHLPSEYSSSTNTRFHFAGTYPNRFRTPAFAAQIVSHGLWQHPNLVLSTHLNFTVAAYWLKRWFGIPYWTVAHGVEAWNIQQPAVQRALRHANRILAVSHYTRDRLLKEQNLDPNKISVLPNTFEPERFAIAAKPTYLLNRHSLTPEQPVLLTVSRLSHSESYKGYNKVLEALPQIRDSIPNIRYIIVGQGDDRPRLEQFIHEHQLQNCVTLAGFIPDAELGDYYHLCDVFAMPSKGEGFGIVYLEALACGKPTVGGNQDGAIDALCQGELGALVDPDDIGAIAQTLIAIVQKKYPHPLIYQPEALRQKVIEVFGFEHFQKTLGRYLASHFMSHPLAEAPF